MDTAHVRLVEAALLVVHVLGGGVWIGAMVFSIFILHPRAETFFARAVDFEHFIFHVIHRQRRQHDAGDRRARMARVTKSARHRPAR